MFSTISPRIKIYKLICADIYTLSFVEIFTNFLVKISLYIFILSEMVENIFIYCKLLCKNHFVNENISLAGCCHLAGCCLHSDPCF